MLAHFHGNDEELHLSTLKFAAQQRKSLSDDFKMIKTAISSLAGTACQDWSNDRKQLKEPGFLQGH